MEGIFTTEDIDKILNGIMQQALHLKTNHPYIRTHDDHEGTFKGRLCVTLSSDGDAWPEILNPEGPLRFRSYFGGSASPRTYNALLILARAIELDNLEYPERV